jgi:hypothetical protein
MNVLKLLKKEKKAEGKSYFDLSAEEKKKIIKKAAEESNKMQRDLIKQYDKLASTA